MRSAQKVGQDAIQNQGFPLVALKKIRGGVLLVLGFMLSPLSWWNDLFFNLPIAYGFGYVCSWVSPNLFLPCAIAGYWISCIAGIILMQVGAVDIFQNIPKERNFKKDLFMGIAHSSAYTLIILALIQFKIIDTAAILSGINMQIPLPGKPL